MPPSNSARSNQPPPGLSLRDQLAMAALASLNANDYTSSRWSDDMAVTAYRIADSKLQARSKNPQRNPT